MPIIPDDLLADAALRLGALHDHLAERFPGPTPRRQPVHTVYGGAHLFRRDTARRLGDLALAALDAYAPDPTTFARALGLPGDERLHEEVYRRVRAKLESEPVEDFRLDFEDGYGNRPDAEEDGHAQRAAIEVAAGLADGTLPPFIGIRVKPLTAELWRRSLRTLERFLEHLVEETGGRLPPNLVVTLPKVRDPREAEVFGDVLTALEEELGLPFGSVPFEVMVETPQAIYGDDGHVQVRRIVDAADGRCIAAHFGTYDYTASLDITAAHQTMTHPACDHARHVMQVALAGTGIWLSDGATNVLPVPVHRGDDLTDRQREENRRAVHDAWRLHHVHIRHSLVHGYYQGWDLHPAQLPSRYGAVFSFFLEGLDEAADRLRTFVEQAARATLVGDVFDDAATGQGLLNFFLRAVNCGAVTEDEVTERTGLTLAELRTRSFVRILDGRRRG